MPERIPQVPVFIFCVTVVRVFELVNFTEYHLLLMLTFYLSPNLSIFAHVFVFCFWFATWDMEETLTVVLLTYDYDYLYLFAR